MGLERLTQEHQFDKDVTVRGKILSGALGTDLYTIITSVGGGGGSSLTSAVTADLAVGALSALSILREGATLQHCMDRLLTQVYFPVVNPAPSGGLQVTIGGVQYNSGVEVEVGSDTTNFTGSLNRGSWRGALVGGVWNANQVQIDAAGSANNYTFFGVNNNGTINTLTTATNIKEGSTSYNISVGHNAGAQPVNSKGVPQPAYPSGTATGSMTINGRRRLFFSNDTANSAPSNSADVRALTGVIGTNGGTWPADGTSFNIPVRIGTRRITIAYPTSFGVISEIKNGLGFNVTGDFGTPVTISVDGLNNLFPTNYYVYTYIAAGTFASDETYSVIV